MNIGVIDGLKNSKNLKMMKSSILSSGNKFTYIKPKNKYAIKQCDCICMPGYNVNAGSRKIFYDIAKSHQKDIIYIDRGITKRDRVFCINRPKRLGTSYVEDYAERGMRPGFSIMESKPWRTDGDFYSVLFHNPLGYKSNTSTVEQQKKYLSTLIQQLKDIGQKYHIKFHPKAEQPSDITLEEAINQSKCCVGWHTNALCESILHGTPTISLDEECFVYNLSTHNLTDNLIRPDREEWITRMSWCQWSIPEIYDGKQWKVIENAIHNFV